MPEKVNWNYIQLSSHGAVSMYATYSGERLQKENIAEIAGLKRQFISKQNKQSGIQISRLACEFDTEWQLGTATLCQTMSSSGVVSRYNHFFIVLYQALQMMKK